MSEHAGAHFMGSPRQTVLVVEDELSVAEIIHEFLQNSGFIVLQAADAKSALELARQHAGTIDLLVTDMLMPGISGLNLSLLLVTERPNLRILYMSGFGEDSFEIPAMPGNAAFIQKPFRLDAFLQTVKAVLDAVPVAA